jgi:hypothetical protein
MSGRRSDKFSLSPLTKNDIERVYDGVGERRGGRHDFEHHRTWKRRQIKQPNPVVGSIDLHQRGHVIMVSALRQRKRAMMRVIEGTS